MPPSVATDSSPVTEHLNGQTIKYKGEKLVVQIEHYSENNAIAIRLFTQSQELHSVLTVCLPGQHLNERYILVKSWAENKNIADAARNCGLFEDTQRRIPTGYCLAEIWKVSDKYDLLTQYDINDALEEGEKK